MSAEVDKLRFIVKLASFKFLKLDETKKKRWII